MGLLDRWRRLWRPAPAPSRTGQAVALMRAGLDRPSSPQGDPDAQRRLCSGMRATPGGSLRPHMLARTRFFDDQVLAALAAGVPQVVVCGAGYDDRALRFRATGVRFFELDQPATQADKARRLRRIGAEPGNPTLVPADFGRDDAAALLDGHGHDPRRPTLFICEGLLVYLEPEAIGGLLAGLAARAAPGSTLAASLAVHGDELDSRQVVAAANARRRSGRSEPWRTILPVQQHLRLLSDCGWSAVQTHHAPSAAGRPRGSLLVSARPR
jgi:methyltransferase (TIGR00027 family)